MRGDDLQQPVRVSLVWFQVHRKAMWRLRAGAGMATASRVVRKLIRGITPATLDAMQRHFASSTEARESLGRLVRSSVLIDASDLGELDRLVRKSKAPSRSAATRFLVLNAEREVRS